MSYNISGIYLKDMDPKKGLWKEPKSHDPGQHCDVHPQYGPTIVNTACSTERTPGLRSTRVA